MAHKGERPNQAEEQPSDKAPEPGGGVKRQVARMHGSGSGTLPTLARANARATGKCAIRLDTLHQRGQGRRR